MAESATTEQKDRALAKIYVLQALERLKQQRQIASKIDVEVDLDPETRGRLCVKVSYTNRAGVTRTVNVSTGT